MGWSRGRLCTFAMHEGSEVTRVKFDLAITAAGLKVCRSVPIDVFEAQVLCAVQLVACLLAGTRHVLHLDRWRNFERLLQHGHGLGQPNLIVGWEVCRTCERIDRLALALELTLRSPLVIQPPFELLHVHRVIFAGELVKDLQRCDHDNIVSASTYDQAATAQTMPSAHTCEITGLILAYQSTFPSSLLSFMRRRTCRPRIMA